MNRLAHCEPLELRRLLSGQINFSVIFDDPAGAYAALYPAITSNLLAAAREWGSILVPATTVDIDIKVGFPKGLPLGNGASATTSFVGTFGTYNMFEQGVAGEIRTGVDPNGPGAPDAILNFGDNYLRNNLWFDPDPAARVAPIPNNRTDAYSVFLHELGHVFAYNGWRDGTTGQLPGNYLSTWDRFIVPADGNFFFAGPNAEQAYHGGALVPVTYGNPNHLGNNPPRPGSDLIPQLMNGVVFTYSTRYDISDLDVGVFRDVGLPLETVRPTVISSDFEYQTRHALHVRFSESVRASLELQDVILRNLNDGSTVLTSAMSLAYDRATNTATVTFPGLPGGLLPDGNYQLTVLHTGVHDLAGNGLAADHTLNFFFKRGDANHDGLVNLSDFNILAGNFGQSARDFTQGDFNYDGSVNLVDFNILASRFGTGLASQILAVAHFQRPDSDDRGWLEIT